MAEHSEWPLLTAQFGSCIPRSGQSPKCHRLLAAHSAVVGKLSVNDKVDIGLDMGCINFGGEVLNKSYIKTSKSYVILDGGSHG